MNSSTFSWKNARGLQLFAQDWCPVENIRGVVALMHGLGEHVGRYQHVAEAFNAAGFALVGFDYPGHGQSEGTRGHAAYDELLEDIDHLLGEITLRYPGVPQFMYGHSLGGAITLYYCLKRRPDLQGVVVSSPGLATAAPVSPVTVQFARVMARLAPSFQMNNGLDVENLSHDPAVVQAYKSDPLVHPKISTRLGLDLITKGQWVQEHAAEFPLPLLLIQGTGDHLISVQTNLAFAKAVPQDKVTLKVWEGQYHETHNELQKEQALQYIISWLDSRL